MLNYQEQVNQLHLEILSLCLKLKNSGHDAFYDYSAHVNWSTVRVFIDGYRENYEPVRIDYLETSVHEYDEDSVSIVIVKLNKCKDYLAGLI